MGEDRRALLQRFRPEVVYDSREAFPAASVSEMLDDPWVTLCRADGTPIAVAGSGESDLNSGFFTAAGYRNGEPHAAGDHISFPEAHHDYRAQARQIEREHPEMADVVYGHLAQDGTAEKRFWVQYWFFMLYNDAQLLGRFGLHEGDWEMVQFRLVGTGPTWDDPQIDLAVYAQHTYAQQADVNQLDLSPEGAPVALAAKVRPAQPAPPLRVKAIATSRTPDNRPQIDFDFEDIDEPVGFPGSLVTTISPITDQAETDTIAVVVDQLLAGSLKLRRPLDADLDYDVSVVWVDGTGEHSQAFDSRLARIPLADRTLLDRALYALRWLLQRVTGKTR